MSTGTPGVDVPFGYVMQLEESDARIAARRAEALAHAGPPQPCPADPWSAMTEEADREYMDKVVADASRPERSGSGEPAAPPTSVSGADVNGTVVTCAWGRQDADR